MSAFSYFHRSSKIYIQYIKTRERERVKKSTLMYAQLNNKIEYVSQFNFLCTSKIIFRKKKCIRKITIHNFVFIFLILISLTIGIWLGMTEEYFIVVMWPLFIEFISKISFWWWIFNRVSSNLIWFSTLVKKIKLKILIVSIQLKFSCSFMLVL